MEIVLLEVVGGLDTGTQDTVRQCEALSYRGSHRNIFLELKIRLKQ